MMFDEIDEKYDPTLFDGIVDFDPDQMDIDEDSTRGIESIEEWLTCFPVSSEVYESQFSIFDIPLIRKEWLIRDALSKRERSPRLFEFLILLLAKPRYESYASFTDRSKGIFQIHKPEKVAELWQAVKVASRIKR